MPRVVAGFTFALSAEAGEFYREMRRVNRQGTASEKAFARLQQSLRRARDAAARFVTNLVSLRGALTAIASAGVIGRIVQRTADLGANLVESAQVAGVSVETFQALGRVFEGDGVSAEQFATGMRALQRRLGDLRAGVGESVQTFARLGLTWRDLQGLSLDRVLERVADGLQGIADPNERVAIAARLLEESGARFLPVLTRGSAALREQIVEMERLGVVSTGSATVLKNLSQDFTDLINIVQTHFANAIAASAGQIRVLIRDVREFAVEHLPTLAQAGLLAARGVQRIAENLGLLAAGIAAVKLGSFLAAIGTWIVQMEVANVAVATLGRTLAFWAGPAGWIALAISILVTFREEIGNVLFGLNEVERAGERLEQTFDLGGVLSGSPLEELTRAERLVGHFTERQAELREEEERLLSLGSARQRQRRGDARSLREVQGELAAVTAELGRQETRLAEAQTAWAEYQDAQDRAGGTQATGVDRIRESLASIPEVARLAAASLTQGFEDAGVRASQAFTRGLIAIRASLAPVADVIAAVRDNFREAFEAGRDAMDQYDRAAVAAAGDLARIRFEVDSARTALDGALIQQQALQSLERERIALQAQIAEAIRRGETELQAQLEQYLAINEEKRTALELDDQQLEALREQCEELKKAEECTEEAGGAWARFKEIGRDALITVLNSLDQLILHTDNLVDGLKRLAAQLAVAAIRSIVLGALGVEGRQFGGPVQAGRPYIVGEAGPEIFQPTVSGTIIPNRAIAGGATFAPVFNISAPDRTVAQIARGEIEAAFPRMLQLWRAQQNRNDARARGLR